ncbi:MAG: phenylacetate-CoA oxygenase subunit PaaC [Flavobacteriales bacterium]|nr:phenylacetate-CoA oxygenase subunit PaaC [Flavobacteriales bacterium]
MTKEQQIEGLYRLADNGLILGQRLSEWCGHGPILEEDIALTNIALDYLGQATLVLKHTAIAESMGRDEDDHAFLRNANEYRNFLICELPNGDYAHTIARQYLFSSWYRLFLEQLSRSTDEFASGFAAKALKEVRYHHQHASDWVLRMGDGTEESHRRIQEAIDSLWAYTGEFFEFDTLDTILVAEGLTVDSRSFRETWLREVTALLHEATLSVPGDTWFQTGGRNGRHTEHLGHLLSDMQYLQRAYPGAKW